VPSPVAGSSDTVAGGAQSYYLTIDGVNGGSAVVGHEGAFAISDYSFDVSALVSALSGRLASRPA
jgi:type VI protein secretion system component Hcp